MKENRSRATPVQIANSRGQRPALSCPPRTFAVEFRIRGEMDSVYHTSCKNVEEAIHVGELKFSVFEGRNPWMVQDSQQQRILILLDP